jgi:hypothetical protein
MTIYNHWPAVVASPQGVPVKINGQYVMYYGQGGNGTYIASSTDMMHWSAGTPVNLDLPSGYSPYEMCVAVTDYQTVAGAPANQDIDMFFAGTLMANGRWYYAISELEFSRSDLTSELDQLTVPVLQPIIFVDGQWRMYYGAGDADVALATAPLRSQASERSYDDFTRTSFEDGQRQPDWADEADTAGRRRRRAGRRVHEDLRPAGAVRPSHPGRLEPRERGYRGRGQREEHRGDRHRLRPAGFVRRVPGLYRRHRSFPALTTHSLMNRAQPGRCWLWIRGGEIHGG